MELQATALKGIVRSSDEGLFYLFPIQDVSTLHRCIEPSGGKLDGTTAGGRAHVEQPRGGIERT